MILFQSKFLSWGGEHLLWLLAGVASMVFWITLGRLQLSELRKRQVGLVMTLIPVVIWLWASVHFYRTTNPLRLDLILPFHVCYFLNLAMPIMLWRRSYALFEVSYFMVMAGTIQALLTPDIQTVFPDIMNLRYFIVHIGLPQSVLYAIFVYGFRPTWRGIGKTLLWTNIYMVCVAGINWGLGTNFMYLNRKPSAPTLLDLFGEWPWYLLGGELLALGLFTLVFLPFSFRKAA